MICVVQRVSSASVTVDGQVVATIGRGMLLLVGVGEGDGAEQASRLASQIAKLRIYPDAAGKMALGLGEVAGEVLAVSQFTLLGDFSKGNRPSFHRAARPDDARPVFDHFVSCLRSTLGREVPTGIFGADMKVALVNDGPVTFVL